jgi:hypothetical protein
MPTKLLSAHDLELLGQHIEADHDVADTPFNWWHGTVDNGEDELIRPKIGIEEETIELSWLEDVD